MQKESSLTSLLHPLTAVASTDVYVPLSSSVTVLVSFEKKIASFSHAIRPHAPSAKSVSRSCMTSAEASVFCEYQVLMSDTVPASGTGTLSSPCSSKIKK